MTAENNISKIDMKVFIQGNVRSRQLFGEKNTEYLPKTEYTISGFQGNDYILTAGKMDSLVAKEDYDKAMLNGDAVETNTSKQTFRMYEYDVWGNNEDGYEVNNIFKTSTTIKLSEDDGHKLEALIEALEENDEVQEVYTNAI